MCSKPQRSESKRKTISGGDRDDDHLLSPHSADILQHFCSLTAHMHLSKHSSINHRFLNSLTLSRVLALGEGSQQSLTSSPGWMPALSAGPP